MCLRGTSFFDVDDTHSPRDCSMRERSFPMSGTLDYTDVKKLKETDRGLKGRWWEWTQSHERGS